ncbi:MAG: IS4 family transposase [Gammaproteobacteria bacterium]|nr:IS4 family transposase [Gammaproteobacteria bacterium]
MHEKTRKSLINHTKSLLSGKAVLSLSSLGRNLTGNALVKHKINMAWRFLCNKTIQKEQINIYKSLFQSITSELHQLVIAVDWSGCCSKKNHLLRASLLHKGRSITIYNEIHPEKNLANETVHNDFLKNLQAILPINIKVIIITDAGFKTPWFAMVDKLGWFFIGRVSGVINYKLDTEKKWQLIDCLHQQLKRGETKYIGVGELSKGSKTRMDVVLTAYWEYIKDEKQKSHITLIQKEDALK